MIDQVKLPRTVPGLGENLLTVKRPMSWAARVRCQICGLELGCNVVAERVGGERNTMGQFDFQFWLAHFASKHPDLLPPEIMADL